MDVLDPDPGGPDGCGSEMSRPEAEPQKLGDVASLIRSKDWSETPLGPAERWPASLRTILQLMLSSRYSMWMGWGPDLHMFYNDEYARQTLGTKHPGVLGIPFREVFSEIWEELRSRIEHVLRTGEATWDEGLCLFLMRDGRLQETYHTFSYSPAPGDAPGQIGGLFCCVVEETERVIGERRIALLGALASGLAQAKTEQEVFAALEACLGADSREVPFSLTYLLDDDGKSASRVARSGVVADHEAAPPQIDVRDSPWPLATVLSTRSTALIPLAEGIAWPRGAWDKAPTHALVLPIAQQGPERPAGVFIAGMNPYRPFEGATASFLGLFVGQLAAGLSNARGYEGARKRADALAAIDAAKTAFFSNISHEFRTPLTLMLGPTEDAIGSPERSLHGDALETVYRNELRLLKLVNALLDFARLEAGRTRASYEPTDLASLTVDLASTFRSAIERAGLALEVECPKLPEPVYVDRDMWEKIVLNLLSNALKFTFEGRITVALSWRDGQAELSVGDTGVGVPDSELPRLFERFHRIEGSRARTHEGSGIGLALVHELVRLHGGTIRVETRLDHGTKFIIAIPPGSAHLPADRVSATRSLGSTSSGGAYVAEALRWTTEPSSSEAETEALPAGASREVRARIMVADDNADMREYITRLLRKHWTVDAYADGAAALEAARQSPPDLVLSDVMMPQLDGFGLLKQLRGSPLTATIPVILLSARAGEEAAAAGLRAGADDYVVKPFSASSLLVRVEAQLSAARLRETMRRNAEAERARLESMFRDAPAAICVIKLSELTVEFANTMILDLWGKGPTVVGKPLLEALPEIRGQGFDDRLREVLDTGEVFRAKEALVRIDRRQDGSLEDLFMDFVYVPLFGPDGKPDAVFVHAYDVTDRVVARKNLESLREAEKTARETAEAANRLKDDFLATMSHELRTPLSAILGWAALLQRGTHGAKETARALETIERNAKAQARLIEDVLDVSRIVSGKLRLDLRRVDAVAISRAALDVVRPAADAKRLHLLADLPADGELIVVGDADRLQQVIWNLLSNAVKFTPPEGTVMLTLEQSASAMRIVVTDTGPGIAHEHLPFVFERFRQVDSSITRRHGGLGLGLAIVRHLAELHGGTVMAESEPGKGATFSVRIPIRALHEGGEEAVMDMDVEASGATAAPGARPVSLSGVEILVVDDDADARTLLETALSNAGATVCAVDSAHRALTHLERHKVDVIVSDIGMPDEDGFSFMARLRALPESRGGKIPAIALTAYARGDDVVRSRAVGYERHVAKPANLEHLAETVESLVTERTQERPTP
jgi:signal transduction histidine kinase/DNA-binding response OmpR family regulator